MRRTSIVTFMALLLVLALAGTALAANPQFRHQAKHTNLTISSGGDLTANFKATGLGNEPVEVVLSASAQALWACKNNGGNYPNDPKKQTVESTVEAADIFTPKNGTVSGQLTVSPPGATGLDCPGNQVATLVQICYSNVKLEAYADPGTRQQLLASHSFASPGCVVADPSYFS
jgi:hypothetical protein